MLKSNVGKVFLENRSFLFKCFEYSNSLVLIFSGFYFPLVKIYTKSLKILNFQEYLSAYIILYRGLKVLIGTIKPITITHRHIWSSSAEPTASLLISLWWYTRQWRRECIPPINMKNENCVWHIIRWVCSKMNMQAGQKSSISFSSCSQVERPQPPDFE